MSDDSTNTETVSKADFDKVQERARTFEARVTDFEKRFKNINPEEVSALKTELDLLRNEKAAKTGDPKDIEERIKSAKEELRQALAGEIESERTNNKTLKAQIKELQVDSKVFTEAAGEFVAGYHPELKRMIKESCDMDEDGNIVIKDDKGEPRYSKANPSKLMTPTEFIAELKEQKDFAVIDRSLAGGKQAGEKRSGSSAKITSITQLNLLSPEKQREALKNMSDEERIAISRTIQIR